MRVRFHATPEAFQVAAGDLLLAHEAENNLMLGLVDAIARGHYERFWLATIEDEGVAVAGALQTPPHRALLSPSSQAALQALAAELHRREPDLSGASGPLEVVESFGVAWCGLTGGSSEVVMRLGVYRLDQVVMPPSPPEGSMRVIGPDDLELSVRWLDGFHRDTGMADPRPRKRSIQRRIREGSMFFWEVDEEPVATAAWAGSTPNGVRIGFVYTPPEHRRRGYASVLTATLSQHMLDQGKRFCILYTDLANPTSNKIYQSIGYRHLYDAAMLDFRVAG